MKTAFLDLDGTLLDSHERHTVVLEYALKKCHIYGCDLSNYLDYKANGNRTIDFLKEELYLDDDISQRVAEIWKLTIEEEKYLEIDTFYSDAVPFLNLIKEKGFKTIIVSARNNKDYLIDRIKISEINYLIDDIIIVSPFHAMNNKLNVFIQNKDKNSVCIGDTEVDYEAGKKAGILTYILNRGFRSKEYWDKKNIRSYCDLFEIVKYLG